MFNDLFLIQSLMFSILFILYNVTTLLGLFFIGLFFLIVVIVYGWFLEFDVFINFLAIIDLGLFFILLAFFINFNNLYNNLNLSRFSTASFKFLIPSLLGLTLVIFFYVSLLSESLLKSIALLTTIPSLSITYLDWYVTLFTNFSSDLQFWSEVYYTSHLYEFIAVNFIIYIGIVCINFIVSYGNVSYDFMDKVHSPDIFMKLQNTQSQVQRLPIVRVWNRNSTSKSF